MTPNQALYSHLENIIRNNPRVRALVDADTTGDAPAVERVSQRRAGAASSATSKTATPYPLPAANTSATATHRL